MRFILYSHILYDKIHICLEHHDVNCGSDFLPYCVTWSYDFAKKKCYILPAHVYKFY